MFSSSRNSKAGWVRKKKTSTFHGDSWWLMLVLGQAHWQGRNTSTMMSLRSKEQMRVLMVTFVACVAHRGYADSARMHLFPLMIRFRQLVSFAETVLLIPTAALTIIYMPVAVSFSICNCAKWLTPDSAWATAAEVDSFEFWCGVTKILELIHESSDILWSKIMNVSGMMMSCAILNQVQILGYLGDWRCESMSHAGSDYNVLTLLLDSPSDCWFPNTNSSRSRAKHNFHITTI